jgi:hypothetical protein
MLGGSSTALACVSIILGLTFTIWDVSEGPLTGFYVVLLTFAYCGPILGLLLSLKAPAYQTELLTLGSSTLLAFTAILFLGAGTIVHLFPLLTLWLAIVLSMLSPADKHH